MFSPKKNFISDWYQMDRWFEKNPHALSVHSQIETINSLILAMTVQLAE